MFPQFLLLPSLPQAALSTDTCPAPGRTPRNAGQVPLCPSLALQTTGLVFKPDSWTPCRLADLSSFGSRKKDWPLVFLEIWREGSKRIVTCRIFCKMHGPPSPHTPMRSQVNKQCSYSAICSEVGGVWAGCLLLPTPPQLC